MTEPCRCACCRRPVEPAQELRFLVETANLDDPAYLARIRRLPAVNGQPLPVCAACQARIEAHPVCSRRSAVGVGPARAGVLAAVGLFSLGWLMQNLLFGPRG